MPYLLVPSTNTGNDLTGGIFYPNSSPGSTLSGVVNGISYRVYALELGPNATPNGPVVTNPIFPTFTGNESLGFAGHSSVGEIFDGGGFDQVWNGTIRQNIIGGDTFSKTIWDANGPERRNPINAIIFSDMDVSPVGRYSAPNTPQGIIDLQHDYYYGMMAANQNAQVIMVWHTTPRHSYDGSYEFNKMSRNYSRKWLSEKINRPVFVLPIDLYVKTLIDMGIPRTQIWRDDYHLANNVGSVGPKLGLRYMLMRMLTGTMPAATAGNENYRTAAITALNTYTWAGTGGSGNEEILTVADPLPNPSPLP